MVATVNASTSAGVVITPDNSGVLAFQSSSATALTIDASQNSTFVGTASATKLIPTGSSVTGNGLYLPAANSLGLSTSGAERMRIDSSGNVGINTASPSTYVNGYNNSLVVGDGTNWATIQGRTDGPSGAGNGVSYGGSYGTFPINGARIFIGATSAGQRGIITFNTKNLDDSTTQPLERMRITSGGNVILGSNTSTTENNVLNLYSPTSTLNGIYINKGSQVECQIGFKTGTNTDFFIGTGSTTMGTNGVYLANAGNSWTSVSDERQKDIIEPIENGLTKVNTLRAVIGKYKHDADGVRRSFLIAQDVQAVLPEAVRAQEDEEALLGLSYTDVIPLLVASIKELKAINDTLTARIVALENR